ncbi:TrmH family RNA methyltransferase [bacterium]|nr:TrmH family RNA methyltransferase [bacterium]
MVRPFTTSEIRKLRPARRDFHRLPKLPLSFVCDNFHYGWNVGALFRIADALRVSQVYLCGLTAFPPDDEIKRTGGQSSKWVSWQHLPSTKECILDLKARGVQVAAAELAHGSIPLNHFEWEKPAAIVLGSEITGVQRGVMKHCDAVIELPMFGMRNSLNVASIAAVLAYDFLFRACGGEIPDGSDAEPSP